MSLIRIQFLSLFITISFLPAADWPDWRGINRDGLWHETGIVEKFAKDQIPIKWRTPIGPGYSGEKLTAVLYRRFKGGLGKEPVGLSESYRADTSRGLNSNN